MILNNNQPTPPHCWCRRMGLKSLHQLRCAALEFAQCSENFVKVLIKLHFIWSTKYVFGLAWSLRCSRTNLVDEWMRLQISTQNIIIIYGCVFMDIHVHFKDALRFVLVFNKLKLS